MANDEFYTRLHATISAIPPMPMPQPQQRPSKQSTAADLVWCVFRNRSPGPGDIICAIQALQRCLQGGQLGWLIWDQAGGWLHPSEGWSNLLEVEFRWVIKTHPPWLVPMTAESRRLANTRANKAQAWNQVTTLDQMLVAKMQSRVKQWLSWCYRAPLSNPRWSALVRRTNADKAVRFRIMQKAVNARLISVITDEMRESLKQDLSELVQKEQHEHARRRRQKRLQRIQQKREEEWRQKRCLDAVLGERLAADLKHRLAEAEREIEELKNVRSGL